MELKALTEDLQNEFRNYKDQLGGPSRSFLIGAGCSKCAGLPLTGELAEHIIEKIKDDEDASNILKNIISNFKDNKDTTIEEYLSELVDYSSILERRIEKGTDNPTYKIDTKDYSKEQLKNVVKLIQKEITELIEAKEFNLNTHLEFTNYIHNTSIHGKEKTQKPTNYFVLNYDTLFEDALSINKINYADGFRGGAIGWWDTSVFDDTNNKARVYKLHGSLDWSMLKEETLPRRLKLKSKHKNYNFDDSVLIYPCATKYKETQNDPFAQLLSMYRDILKNTSTTLLTICGYRFADNHINIEIEKSLLEAKNLTVVIFTEIETPSDNKVLAKWIANPLIKPNLKIFAKKGYYHNDKTFFATNGVNLDWWKFEVLTSLLNN